MQQKCKTGKRCYCDRATARKVAESARTRGVTLYFYHCTYGDHWHQTSKAQSSVTDHEDMRVLAEEQGREIAATESAYLFRRIREQAAEITAEMEAVILQAFKESLDRRLQAEVRKMLGVKL